MHPIRRYLTPAAVFIIIITAACLYWPGLSGGFLFDDFPNIVDNQGVQPHDATISSLIRASLSSPSSDLKRPLSSLSIALNYLASAGLDPFTMKLTNLIIHSVNGLLVFWLTTKLLDLPKARISKRRSTQISLLVTFSWLILPINLTAVLYVVQRMESLANAFVLLGLIGYIVGRCRSGWKGFALSSISLIGCTFLGVLSKETAVMLPVYALLVEWIFFRFGNTNIAHPANEYAADYRVAGLFVVVLILPAILGIAWLLPSVINPEAWSTRNFTLGTRLLSEARVLIDYIVWAYIPTPHALSFYHDDFQVSRGLLTPWTTLPCLLVLLALAAIVVAFQRQQPLLTLGVGFYLACHLLTGTIIPLELVYEHRNYFASYGLMLALLPLLASEPGTSMQLVRRTLLVCLILLWSGMTLLTSQAWGNPLRLAEDLAERAPNSPRAQYELGRTYIVYSHYDPNSPFTQLAYAPLERAAKLPDSSILPEQALIFMNARMHLPLKSTWWQSMLNKLSARKSTVQDESALGSLISCARQGACDLPPDKMTEVLSAALNHPAPTGRLLSEVGDYTLNVLHDTPAALEYFKKAVAAAPNEPVYKVTLIRLLIVTGQTEQARDELARINSQQKLMLSQGTLEQLEKCLSQDPNSTCSSW